MTAARYDQIHLVPLARSASRVGPSPRLLDREFSEEYRDAGLPAGWFIIPSALIALACLFLL